MSEEQLQFRKMCVEDISAVAAIERMVFSRPWTERSFAEAVQQDTLFVVVLKKNTIVGYCGMYCSYEEGEITNVAVMPQVQGHGIGRKMMQFLLRQAGEKGISRVFLEVRISNRNAIHLYENLGFKNCGIRKNFYELPREDGMVMMLEGGAGYNSHLK